MNLYLLIAEKQANDTDAPGQNAQVPFRWLKQLGGYATIRPSNAALLLILFISVGVKSVKITEMF